MEATQGLQGGWGWGAGGQDSEPSPIPALTRAALILIISFVEVLNVHLEQIEGVHDKKVVGDHWVDGCGILGLELGLQGGRSYEFFCGTLMVTVFTSV